MKHPDSCLNTPNLLRRPALYFGTLICTLGASLAIAGGKEIRTHVITVETDGSDVIEADVTDVELGESLNFVTESGRIIDILKAADGFEIYIDGDLLDTHGEHHDLEQLHRNIAIHEEELEFHCDDGDAEACEAELDALLEEEFEHAQILIARHGVSEVCDEDDNCDVSVRIEKDSELAMDLLDEDSEARVIIIEKQIDGTLY